MSVNPVFCANATHTPIPLVDKSLLSVSDINQPFFSTKPSGTGLGLAITKRIVNAHGGELSIESDTVIGSSDAQVDCFVTIKNAE